MKRSFDYIIVGGGSAGCVLANRLSAQPESRVLLIEAGPSDWIPVFRVPIMAGRLFLGKYCNWSYLTEPEPHLNGRRIPWPRGRVLGGSSAINGMIYARGSAQDYDGWAQMGLRAWSYERVLPYFKSSESHFSGASDYHGGDGPLPVTRLGSRNPLFQAFTDAGLEAGYPFNADFNGACQEGFGRYDYNIKNGVRWSSAHAFLTPARSRPNLAVLTSAQLLRVRLDKRRAIGVAVSRRGETLELNAEREVILSCGAIGSPMALMHSGIGNADHVRALGIAPLVDLKSVGENLQDHLQVRVSHISLTPDETYDECRLDRAVLRFAQAMLLGTGPFSRFPHEGGAFIRSSANIEAPDLQIHFIAGGVARIRHLFSKPSALGGWHDGYTISGSICQLRPESRGRLSLKSADPREPPVIEANYLSSAADRRALRDGVKLMREIFAQKAFDPHRGPEIVPGVNLQSDEGIDRYIAETASTIFHPVGTCRMGIDAESVVDEALRVRGVEGLRVADASVMPRIVSANTHAPTVMIAERASDFILGA